MEKSHTQLGKNKNAYCTNCGIKLKKRIIPIEPYEIKLYNQTVQDFDGEKIKTYNFPRLDVKRKETFDSKSGEQIYSKIMYCPNKCITYCADEGTKKEILKRKQIFNNWGYFWDA